VTQPLAIGAIAAVAVVTGTIGARGVRVARTPADFLVAARNVPPVLNASAISGEYLSAASFLGIAGLALQDGLGALWYAVGYAAGYLVLLAVVAAPLRRFGAYTIPDFAEGRLDSRVLRKAATAMVMVICGFYLLPQLKGAGIVLDDVFGASYWVGVVVLGGLVTLVIASGGMKGITLVQAFQFWLKLAAISIPALTLLAIVAHPPVASVSGPAPAVFARPVDVRFPAGVVVTVVEPETVHADGQVDGVLRDGSITLTPGDHSIAAGASVKFPAGARAPAVRGEAALTGRQWSSPLVRLNGRSIHPLAATYGIILATFLGALGLPHILVRFYTNPDGQSARQTTAIVLLLLSCFYVFPAVFALLGRLEAPGLYVSGQTDSVLLVLPRMEVGGLGGSLLAALTAAGAFAAFLSTSSGLLIAMAGALSHDILDRGARAFRVSALIVGAVATATGLLVAAFSISVLVGWAFAIAGSSLCPLLVLGIWWPRLTWVGALAGLAIGGGASSAAVVASMAGVGTSGWPAVLLGAPATWTVPLSFAAMIIGSRLSPSTLPVDVTHKLLALHLPEQVRVPDRARPHSAP
jgi:Na+(H+)/acetate symporter ActP